MKRVRKNVCGRVGDARNHSGGVGGSGGPASGGEYHASITFPSIWRASFLLVFVECSSCVFTCSRP
jgi:hypothetical protein